MSPISTQSIKERLSDNITKIKSVRRKGSIASRFKDIFIGVILIVVLVLVVAAFVAPIVSTTNSLTTGATPVISGGGAAVLGQVPLLLGVVVIVIVLGLVFLVFDYIQNKRGR